MNILTVSSMAWDDTNAIGNTFSNWFSGSVWKDDTFYHLSLRKQNPENDVCKNYYQISVFDIVNPLKKREKIGKRFQYTRGENCVNDMHQRNEKQLIKLLHKMPLGFIYFMIDIAYRSKRWENLKLKEFIQDASIDVVFLCVTDVSFLAPFVEYIKAVSNAQVISYIPDDMRARFEKTSLFRRKKLMQELEAIIKNSDLVFCASNQLAEHYSEIYDKKMLEIYKGCKIDSYFKHNVGNPIKIVYTGNVFYGRDKIIERLIKDIELFNKNNNQKYSLDIYCGNSLLQSDIDKLNVEGVSHFYERQPYDVVCKKIKDYDLFLIPESFDEDNKVYTRYSFSTKIPESLQSGINILAIGPKDVSTMSFLRNLPFVYYTDSEDGIYDLLEQISNEKDTMIENRSQSIGFAKEKFELENNRLSIRKAIMSTFV